MTRAYVENYGLIDWTNTPEIRPRAARSTRAVHYISDHMDPTVHMATGEVIDSKSKFRQRTREAGCVEVGNEKFPEREKPSRQQLHNDMRNAIEKLRSR